MHADDHCGAKALHIFQDPGVERFSTSRFDEPEENVTSIQDRDRKHVQNGQVHIQDHAEPERETPPVLALEQEIINANDADGTAQVLELDVRFWRSHSGDRIESAAHTVTDLFNRRRMRQRHLIGPLNADARLLFRTGRQERGLHCEIERRSSALHM